MKFLLLISAGFVPIRSEIRCKGIEIQRIKQIPKICYLTYFFKDYLFRKYYTKFIIH